MTTLVLTVIGDDRAGLVKALADVVSAHDGNWEQSHLAELAGQFAGIVVVTVPGGGPTTKLIDRAAIAAMKPTGIFVNISRGEVVDEEALIDALEAGAIAGAGLDVYEKEPHVPERLRALENCTLLPHLGSATVETRQAMGQMALDNIIAWDKGLEPPQRVN